MDENALPQEPQTPTPPPAPKKCRVMAARRFFCLMVYMLSGIVLGVAYGVFCVLMLYHLYDTAVGYIDTLILTAAALTGVALLGGLSTVTGVILGKHMAAVNGAFKRWVFYGVIGTPLGAAVGVLLMWGVSLVCPSLSDEGFPLAYFLTVAGMFDGISGGLVFATIGCLRHGSDTDTDTKRTGLRTATPGVILCVLDMLAMAAFALISTSSRAEGPASDIGWCVMLLPAAVAIGTMLDTILSLKYARTGLIIGLLLGALIGGTLGAAFCEETLLGATFSMALGVLLGALAGSVIGAVLDGTVDGEAILTAGGAETAAWTVFWLAFRTSDLSPGLIACMVLAAMLFGILGRWYASHFFWGTCGKTGALLGAAFGTLLGFLSGFALAVYLDVIYSPDFILLITLLTVQGTIIGITLGAYFGVFFGVGFEP